MMSPQRYAAALTFPEYLQEVEANRDLWNGLWERAALPDDLLGRAAEVKGRWHLAALTEDWCGDAVNSLVWVARLAEAAPGVELRVFSRDDNPDLMDAHLTEGVARSIPVVIAYGSDFRETGWWGPRPTELQRWVKEEGLKLDVDERYARVRRWYARDRGRSTVAEILDLLDSTVTVGRG